MMPARPVIATSLATGEVIEFASLRDAQRAGFSQKYIKLCCKGMQESHKGYTWKTLADLEWDRLPKCYEYAICCFRDHGRCTALSNTIFTNGFCTFRKESQDGPNLYDRRKRERRIL